MRIYISIQIVSYSSVLNNKTDVVKISSPKSSTLLVFIADFIATVRYSSWVLDLNQNIELVSVMLTILWLKKIR